MQKITFEDTAKKWEPAPAKLEDSMIDRWAMKVVRHPLALAAMALHKRGVRANLISLLGFFLGMLAVPCLYLYWYAAAFFCIAGNRIADGLDGNVARLNGATDAGGYLDITFDFIFYAAVVLGFALADPAANSLPAAVLLLALWPSAGRSPTSAIPTKDSIISMDWPKERRQLRSCSSSAFFPWRSRSLPGFSRRYAF